MSACVNEHSRNAVWCHRSLSVWSVFSPVTQEMSCAFDGDNKPAKEHQSHTTVQTSISSHISWWFTITIIVVITSSSSSSSSLPQPSPSQPASSPPFNFIRAKKAHLWCSVSRPVGFILCLEHMYTHTHVPDCRSSNLTVLVQLKQNKRVFILFTSTKLWQIVSRTVGYGTTCDTNHTDCKN
jgi:hypothetical protein